MNDAGWVLGIICSKHFVEPLNLPKVIFCAKALLSSKEPRHVYEGLGILMAISAKNDDSVISMICTDNTLPRLVQILTEYLGNDCVIDRCINTIGNIATSNSAAICRELFN